MIKRLLIILTIVATSLCADGQNQPTLKVISITANGFFNFPDTIYGNQYYGYQIVVQNLDTSVTYNDTSGIPFSIMMRSDPLAAFSIYTDSGGFFIAPGDTEVFNTVDSFPGTGLKLGNNVVVVWPSKTGGTQPFYVDSTYDSVYFTYTTGIYDPLPAYLSVYPNPFSDYLKIDFNDELLSQLFIYDATGKLVYNSNGRQESYDLSFLKNGMYLIEVCKNNATVARKKMMKY